MKVIYSVIHDERQIDVFWKVAVERSQKFAPYHFDTFPTE